MIEFKITPLGKCNFNVPVSVIPCEVCSHSNTPIIHLTKIDPFQSDWGQFEWHFKVVDKNNYPIYPSLYNATGVVDNNSNNNGHVDQNMIDSFPTADVVNSASDEKSCP